MAKTRINAYQIEPGSNGQIIKMASGSPDWVTWAADVTGIMPANVVIEDLFYADGAATSFTLSTASVVVNTLQVYVDGIRQGRGASLDYTASVNGLFVFNSTNIPEATQIIVADYRIVE